MTIALSWGTLPATLDVALPQMPDEFEVIFPATADEVAFDGSEIVTGLEGRRARFDQLAQAQWHDLYLRSGGAGVYTVDGYIRCPKFDDDEPTTTWCDYTCTIHMPRGYKQHKLWGLRVGLEVLITDMEFWRLAV